MNYNKIVAAILAHAKVSNSTRESTTEELLGWYEAILISLKEKELK